MSKPRYGWWSYAKFMARNYPNLCRELEDKQATSTTANYSLGPRGSGEARGAEAAALLAQAGGRDRQHLSREVPGEGGYPAQQAV